MSNLKAKMDEYRKLVDNRLEELLEKQQPELLFASMKYSVSAGGKRLRPVLTLLTCEMLEGDVLEVLDIACAIEMIHTYSLIHDDLPALDNDSLRRGKPTNHVVFGEAQAILAGDALLNYAYEVMLSAASYYEQNIKSHLKAISMVARAAGVFGMIAGQVQDVSLEGKSIDEDELMYIHTHKTGDMITGAVLAGAQIAGATQEEFERLYEYSKNIGLAFQIVDDVLDTGSSSLGKTVGKDAMAGKTTFASMYGNEKAMSMALQKTEEAKAALNIFGFAGQPLIELADQMLNRNN